MDSTKIFLLIVGNIIHIALSLIFFYSIRLIFDIEVVGYYGTILSFFTAISFVNDLGLQLAYLKFFSESDDPHNQASCNGTFLGFRMVQMGIYVVLALILIPVIPIYPGDIAVVYFFLLGMIFLRISFFDQVLFSKKEVVKKSISSIFYLSIKTLLLILLAAFYENDIWLLVNIILISNSAYFILNYFFIRKKRFGKPSKLLIKKFLKFSLPFFLTNSLIFIVSNLDMLLINSWANIDDVANYFTAKQFFSYFLIITSSISNILITTFSKNVGEGKGNSNITIINYTHKLLNLIIIPIILLIFLYATDSFVFIFGEEYRLTGQILNFFVILLIPLSLDFANIVHLQALEEVHFIAKFSVIENALSIFFMVLFISPDIFTLGVFGGALSYLAAKILIQLIYRPIIYRKFKLGFYWGVIRNLIIMMGIYLIQLWINSIFIYPVYLFPIFGLIDITLYFLISYVFKGFSKQDFKFIFTILNIKNIYTTISLEMKDDET